MFDKARFEGAFGNEGGRRERRLDIAPRHLAPDQHVAGAALMDAGGTGGQGRGDLRSTCVLHTHEQDPHLPADHTCRRAIHGPGTRAR